MVEVTPGTPAGRRRRTSALTAGRFDAPGTTALLCVAAALLETAADVLPDDSLFWVVTPLRLTVMVGLAAVRATGLPAAAWRTRLDLPILVLLAAVGAGSLWQDLGLSGFRALLTVVGVYYLVVVLRRARPATGHALAHLALMLVVIPAAVAVGQVANQTPTGFCRRAFTDIACTDPEALVRVAGTFANPNLLAAYLVLLLPLAAVGAHAAAGPSARILSWAMVSLGCGALLATFSRGGIIGLLVAAGVGAALARPAGMRVPGWLRTGGATLLGGVLVAAVAAGVGVRAEIWWAAVRAALDHPLGVGPGRAGPVVSAEVAGDREFAHVHTLWLNWYVGAGVVGGTAVVVITLLVALRLRAVARSGDPVTVAVAAGLAGFAVLCLADHPANSLGVSVALWALLGLAETSSEGPGGRRPASGGVPGGSG